MGLLQKRDVSVLGWMLHRLGLVHSVSATQETTLKSSDTPSFTRSLQLTPAEDTDGVEEPPPQRVREISAQSSTCASSSSPERFETWSWPTEANHFKEHMERKRAGVDAQDVVGLSAPLPSAASVSATSAAAPAPASPAMQSLTIKLLAPAAANDGARCYWGSARSARAANMFTLVGLTSTATVGQVKARVTAETGISPASLQLLLFGCKLQDARTLKSYGIDNVIDPLIHALPL